MTRPESKTVSSRLVTTLAAALLMCAAISGLATVARGQGLQDPDFAPVGNEVPRQVENVTVEQNLGGKIPTNLPLTDSMGRKVKTGYFIDGKKPTIITLNYSSCPMLCSVQLNQLTQSLSELDLQLGEDFQILTISIDPKETTETIRKTKASYVDQVIKQHPNAEKGWAFCTASQPIITHVADLLGFRYTYDSASGEYYHPAMLAFLSPEGVITRYSLDVAFEPDDLRKALVEAGQGTVGNPVDQIVLWCFSYDPASNSYVPQAWRIMRIGGATTIGLMLVCLAPYWIGRKRSPRSAAPDQTSFDPSAASGSESPSASNDN